MSAVMNVDAASFEKDVLERSRSVPVVVDFWAPWCGPCKSLGPVLERIAEESQGAFVLAKVNTDENQELSASFGIRGIPAVKVFREDRVVDEFVGALPETEVRSFLARHLPSPAEEDFDRGRALESSGDAEAALAAYRKTVERDPRHSRCLLALGRLLHQRGDRDQAREVLRRVPTQSAEEATAEQLLAAIDIEAEAEAFEETACRERLRSDASDLEARLGLGLCLAAGRHYKEALEELLASVAHDKTFQDGAARKAMLKVFEIVGQRSELAEHFRGKLANILY